MFNDNFKLKIFSLLIALTLFLSVNDNILSGFSIQSNKSNYTTTWVRAVPIEVNYDKDKYYVQGVPDTVDVKITGPAAKVQKEVVSPTLKVRADFSNIEVGDDQKIKLEVVNLNKDIEAVSNPEFITVSVKTKTSRKFKIKPTLKNERLLLGYTIKSISVSDSEITISGAEESLNNIYEVRAESTEKTKISSNVKEEAKIVAYDRNFNKIEDIDMEKNKTTISVEVESIEKTVPIKVNKIGNIPDNFDLESITVDPESVNVKASSKSDLENINEAYVDVEISTIDKETTEITNLKLYAETSTIYNFDVSTVKVIIKARKK